MSSDCLEIATGRFSFLAAVEHLKLLMRKSKRSMAEPANDGHRHIDNLRHRRTPTPARGNHDSVSLR
jgi:hypothetical protein